METAIIFSFAMLAFAVSEFAARPERDVWRSL